MFCFEMRYVPTYIERVLLRARFVLRQALTLEQCASVSRPLFPDGYFQYLAKCSCVGKFYVRLPHVRKKESENARQGLPESRHEGVAFSDKRIQFVPESEVNL